MTFTVHGSPVGYYAHGKAPNRKRLNAYHAYMQRVQQAAICAGLKLPLTATRERPLLIRTVAYFADGVHCDPENVRKGVADALFYVPKGLRLSKGTADKYTGGSFAPPLYDAADPRVRVTIKELPGVSGAE